MFKLEVLLLVRYDAPLLSTKILPNIHKRILYIIYILSSTVKILKILIVNSRESSIRYTQSSKCWKKLKKQNKNSTSSILVGESNGRYMVFQCKPSLGVSRQQLNNVWKLKQGLSDVILFTILIPTCENPRGSTYITHSTIVRGSSIVSPI